MLKVICNQKNLIKAIAESQKAVSNKTTMDILKNFYIQAFKDGSMKITGYDLEISIESILEANVLEEGEVLINAKLFGDIVRKLPQSDIELSVQDDTLCISCGSSKFNLKYEDVRGYPKLPLIQDCSFVEVNQELFKQMVTETIFATSQDATKPVLMGELLEVKNNQLNIVAIDGYRLAVSTTNKLENDMPDSKLIIPAKALQSISSLLNSNVKSFKFGFSDKYVMFSIDDTVIKSRLLEGVFVEYQRLLPNNYNTLVVANRKELLNCIERASLLIANERNSLVKFVIRDNTLSVIANADYGNCNEEMNVTTEGDYLDIAFNSRYLMEALKVIDTEDIRLEFTSNVNPCIIKPVHSKTTDKDYTYLVLPVRIASNI